MEIVLLLGFTKLSVNLLFCFRQGSVVAEFQLMFKNKLDDEEALAPLKKAVEDGEMGSLKVDRESLKIKKEVEGNSIQLARERIE